MEPGCSEQAGAASRWCSHAAELSMCAAKGAAQQVGVAQRGDALPSSLRRSGKDFPASWREIRTATGPEGG